MSSPTEAEADEVEELEFKWGKRKGVGGKNKDATFYESFIFDGEEYFLFDCVYVFKDGEPEPYVGKIIKMWTDKANINKVKLLWFFRPREIRHYVNDPETLINELFLACGEGAGVANINCVEGICGKCTVVCTSKDVRNPQPSEDEVRMADFVFYRTFDVGLHTVSDKIDDKIAATDVKCIFNRRISQTPSSVAGKRDNIGSDVPNNYTPIASKKLDNISENNIILKSRIDAGKDESSAGKLLSNGNPMEGEEEVKASVDMETRPFKKAKVGSFIENSVAKNANANYAKLKSSPVEGGEEVKAFIDMETRPCKKTKVDSSIPIIVRTNMKAIQRPNLDSDELIVKDVPVSVAEDRRKSKLSKDHLVIDGSLPEQLNHGKQSEPPNVMLFNASNLPHLDENVSKRANGKSLRTSNLAPPEDNRIKLKSDENIPKLSNGKLLKASNVRSTERDNKDKTQVIEVTRRPDAEKSRWFKELPWEERMQSACKLETLVLLQNLDPSYTSAQVEDIVWHGFTETCTAKRIHCTGNSSPHTGQALVVFKNKEAAEKVVRKLDRGVLLLPNGRPLVGSFAVPSPPKKESTLVGHFSIDRAKFQMQRGMKEAVSTSHCSQPNTIEYEMAMEWCLLQDRSALAWKKLYKRQADEIRKAKAALKSK